MTGHSFGGRTIQLRLSRHDLVSDMEMSYQRLALLRKGLEIDETVRGAVILDVCVTEMVFERGAITSMEICWKNDVRLEPMLVKS